MNPEEPLKLIYAQGEIYWMTGVLLVGIIYGIFALMWAPHAPKHEDD